jgi:FlaA1/EpsC-like NDP-sugar epimerase
VIVTGGTGSIGSEIVRHLLNTHASQIRIYSRDEYKQHELQQRLPQDDRLRFLIGDIRDKERMDFAFQGVDICFHTAALKHVAFCEYNPFEAIKTNVMGAQNVIDLALKHNLEKVVAISTDKAVNPTSVLGTSKLMMEKLITAANQLIGEKRTRFSSVRFGNVLSSRGSVLPIWLAQIDQGGPLTITDKRATRFFMDVPEAVNLVFAAAEVMHGGEIFVLKMKKKFKIVDFARDVIQKHAPGKKVAMKFIGLRPGEKLHEELLTPDEVLHAFEVKDMFVIQPTIMPSGDQKNTRYYKGSKKTKVRSYRSDQ